jgi:hypothetical protein
MNYDIKDNKRVKVKVKVALVQALRFCTGRTAKSGSRVLPLFHDHGTRSGPRSSVGIVTFYGLGGPGIESRWRRNFPHQS